MDLMCLILIEKCKTKRDHDKTNVFKIQQKLKQCHVTHFPMSL